MPRAILFCLCLTVSSSLGDINDEFSSLLQSHRTLERDDLDSQVNFGKNGLNWGLTLKHLKKYADWCNAHKVVLIFRQSEKDTLKRIHQGTFKTKSVDVKDKSSNWGLTSGFVPLDKHFSKKAKELSDAGSKPDPDIKQARLADIYKAETNDKADVAEHPVRQTHISAIELVLSAEQVMEVEAVWNATGGEKSMLKNGMSFPMAYYSGHYWYLKPTKSDHFEVQWCTGEHPACTAAEPVWVWAYGGAAVTGDYDLWLAAPHIMSPVLASKALEGEAWKLKFQKALLKKVNSDPKVAVQLWAARVALHAFDLDKNDVPGGVSTMPKFLHHLVKENTLNTILGHPWNTTGFKVINHGAEMQNFDFAQSLDDKLTIIVPKELSTVASSLELVSAKSAMTENALSHLKDQHDMIWMAPTRSTKFANFIISARYLGYLAPLNAEYYKTDSSIDPNFFDFACLMTSERPNFLAKQKQFYKYMESTLIPNYTQCTKDKQEIKKHECQDVMKRELSQGSSFNTVFVISNTTEDMGAAWASRIELLTTRYMKMVKEKTQLNSLQCSKKKITYMEALEDKVAKLLKQKALEAKKGNLPEFTSSGQI